MDDAEARERVARVEALLADVERLTDAGARETAMDLVQALVELYGEGLERIVDHVAGRDGDGALAEAFAADELVSHLLMVHDLHPEPLEHRVSRALASVRDAELLAIEGGVVRVRADGGCVRASVEQAVRDAVPEAAAIEIEEAPAGIPLPMAGGAAA
jgi:hypothetical protein